CWPRVSLMDAAILIIELIVVLGIVLYATWLLTAKLTRGEPKFKSFGEWVRHLFEAIFGL
ncbi:MAG: hypothetical protein KF747_21350, partial [Nitrospira sp.]|nr:hypothetical protein [Nitrospira sp.]